jgi:hypothetical protein
MSIFAAFILALLISLLFAPGYRKGSYLPLALFFFLLFLAGVASQYWITPFGPVWWGVSWGPLGFILLLFTLLFIVPSPYERTVVKTNVAETPPATAAISIFMWLLLLMLLVAIVLGIFIKPAS